YFGTVLGFLDHLKNEQITKNGLRFWFPAGDNSDIGERVERGPAARLPVHTYQLDRGRFENYLGEEALKAGIDLVGSARIRDVSLGDDLHTVTYTLGGKESTDEHTVQARWLLDAGGRAFILKRKLGLLEDNGHVINSSWFRLAGGMDLEDWADPGDEEFFGRM